MIARLWHGRIRSGNAERYYRYIEDTGLRDYTRTPGNRGVYYLERREGEVTHVVTLTFWESIDAIKRFAGDDHERARYYPEDDAFLLEREATVLHYDVRYGERRMCDDPESQESA
jgi:heme-degrading monooxygenase HmoA